jgi:hypothetical protein
VLVPFVEQCQNDIDDVKGLQRLASSSLDEMVAARKNIKVRMVDEVAAEIKEKLPQSCGSRLSKNYGILLYCTELVSVSLLHLANQDYLLLLV